MTKAGHPLKLALRNKMKNDLLTNISPESRKQQSDAITKKVIATSAFQNATRISVFLSTPTEVDTIPLLEEMFKQRKEVFVPSYEKRRKDMLRLHDMRDYESLPVTKHNIKQPRFEDGRESALETGGIDLFFVPGLAFSTSGGRLGYGMGFYDMFFHSYFEKHPKGGQKGNVIESSDGNEAVLMALAFKEQIIPEDQLPLEAHDFELGYIVTEGNVYESK